MKLCAITVFLLLVFLPEIFAAPFDDSQSVRRQYDDFRQQHGEAGHPAINDDAGLAQAHLVYGQQALENGDLNAALEHFLAGQELAPDDGRFSLLAGVVYSRGGDEVLAENSLLEAIQLLPDDPEPLKFLADHYYRAGKLLQSEEALRRAAQLAPQDESVRRQLGKVQREVSVEGDMERDINSIFSVKFDGQVHEALADLVVEYLQDAYAEQGALLNYYPQKTIQVILYTRDDYDLTTGAPAWSSGRFDGKIRLPVGTGNVDASSLQRILHHEYNHFLAQIISRGEAPAWFYEGLAMLAEDDRDRQLPHLRAALNSGAMVSFSALEKSFGRFDQDAAYVAYEQSYSFVFYLEQQFGWHTLRDLLEAYGRVGATEEAFASVFNDFGLDYPQLVEEWRAGL